MPRDFDTAAKTWDADEARKQMSLAIAEAAVESLGLTGKETALDYGTGTGALALLLHSRVHQVVAADSSPGMLAVLNGKIAAAGAENISTLLLDIDRDEPTHLDFRPDVMTSAMTLHHVKDTARFARTAFDLLAPGGRVALADLDTEAGDFHADNTGVEHFGFDRDALEKTFAAAGFVDIHWSTAYRAERQTPTGQKIFTIFLLNARRPQ